MKQDSSQSIPLCYFFNENLKLGIESNPTPYIELEKEIKRRNNSIGLNNVSSKPIILSVRFKDCSNVTIIDTPGFRRQKTDLFGEKIKELVTKLITPKHRIILCLEQSTVEWCNSETRPFVEKVDPKYERTIFICTKFNNRLNQFQSSEDTNKFLSTSGYLPEKNVFFISLPSGMRSRNNNSTELFLRFISFSSSI